MLMGMFNMFNRPAKQNAAAKPNTLEKSQLEGNDPELFAYLVSKLTNIGELRA